MNAKIAFRFFSFQSVVFEGSNQKQLSTNCVVKLRKKMFFCRLLINKKTVYCAEKRIDTVLLARPITFDFSRNFYIHTLGSKSKNHTCFFKQKVSKR